MSHQDHMRRTRRLRRLLPAVLFLTMPAVFWSGTPMHARADTASTANQLLTLAFGAVPDGAALHGLFNNAGSAINNCQLSATANSDGAATTYQGDASCDAALSMATAESACENTLGNCSSAPPCSGMVVECAESGVLVPALILDPQTVTYTATLTAPQGWSWIRYDGNYCGASANTLTCQIVVNYQLAGAAASK